MKRCASRVMLGVTRLLAVLALMALASCATIAGDTWHGISPSEFHFIPIVPLRGKGAGGWKVARLVITLVRKSDSDTRAALCPIQVEVPQANVLGAVSDEFAQLSAAEAADTAAHRVLQLGLLSAQMCDRFHREMESLLGVTIPGARVTGFHERSRKKKLD